MCINLHTFKAFIFLNILLLCVESIHKCICTFKYQSEYSYLYSYWPGSGKPQSIFICICLKNDI